ncbi:MAG: hypothetical protein AB8B48_14220 [Pseudomonadales bacterium]
MKANLRRAKYLAVAFVLGMQVNALAAETQEQVTVYSDVAGANELVAGDYTQALKLMAEKKNENKLFMENNLCVAHILGNNFEQAKLRCNAALREAERSRNYGEWLERTKATRVRRLYRERALRHLRLLDSLNAERVVNSQP